MGLGSQASDEDIDAVFIGRDDVSDYNPEQLLPEPPEVIEKVRAWLQPTAYDIAGGEYRRHYSSHVAGTGHWLTSSDPYRDWLQSNDHGLLWIKGIPGSGKSVMAASLINEIAKSNPGAPVLYFFFRQIIDANHEPRALLRDWMDQVLSYSPPLQKQLRAYVEAHRSLESISQETLWNHLRLAFASLPGKVFCVADALDEMDRGNDEFLQTLGELGSWRPKTVKVLITSRPVAGVEVPLRKIPCLHIRLQEALVDTDISMYVHFALSRSSIPESSWKVIADAVPGRANGLFLYAKLAMDAFLEPNVDINAVLLKLPTDLNALYTNLLNEHSKRSGVRDNIQRLILQFVTHSTRPLRLLELAEMIRINFFDDSERDIKATKGLIRAACGPLLEILPDETVSVIHHSFTEYLKGTTRPGETQQTEYPVLQMGPTHARLALQCILYLKSGCLSSIDLVTDEEISQMPHCEFDFSGGGRQKFERRVEDNEVQTRLQHPFFNYAASNWYKHIVKSEINGQDQTEINAKLKELFGLNNNMKAWLQMRWSKNSLGARGVTQLHIAAKTGLVSYVREQLGSFDVNVPDIYNRTPLWWASHQGHAEIISILLENGADPDQPDNFNGVKPLHMAASHDHAAAVITLLKAGVNPLTEKTLEEPWVKCGSEPSIESSTPLMYACNGHVEALEAFLPFIKDDLDLMHRSMTWAISSASSSCVGLLLQQPGVDVNATTDGQTLLYRACKEVDEAMVRILLQAGADVNIKCDPGTDITWRWSDMQETPAKLNCFFALCNRNGSQRHNGKLQAVFQLLIDAGVDIHYRTPSGETALHAASQCPVLIKLLLEAGLDANATDVTGATPLHCMRSSMYQVLPSIELLVEEGHADINATKDDGQTVLHSIINHLDQPIMLKFLEYEPNCSVVDNRGNTPLHTLLQRNLENKDTAKALLARGADPNARNHDGLTPLLQSSQLSGNRKDIIDIFDALLEAGADINAVDKHGNNAIFRSLIVFLFLSEDDPNIDIKRLIDGGITPFQRNFCGETALHHAVKFRYAYESFRGDGPNAMSRLDFLISLGLDVKAVDYDGNNLLHTLAMQNDNHVYYYGPRIIGLWERLIAQGLDLEQKNHAGRTPLHLLCAADTRHLRLLPGKIMPIDFVLARIKDLDIPDNEGITALHMAATCGGLYVKKLIDAGANPLVYTHERLTPLHLAARCRDSNNVGLLLDALRKEQDSADDNDTARLGDSNGSSLDKKTIRNRAIIGVNAEAKNMNSSVNGVGYTPLYYACRSGRPETVSLLLEAGADAKIKNIFQSCLEFEKECHLWEHPDAHQQTGEYIHDAPLKLKDSRRIARYDAWNTRVKGIGSDSTARLEEIVHMLIEHGADMSGLMTSAESRQQGVINLAVTRRRDYTAACLRRAHSSVGVDSTEGLDDLIEFSEVAYRCQQEAAVRALTSSNLIQPEDQDQVVPLHFAARFLTQRQYYLLEELVRLGATFLPKITQGSQSDENENENCTLSHLISLGFTSLVDKIASVETVAKLDKGEWHAFGDESRPGLFFSKRNGSDPYFKPFIHVAVRRELPNMDMVRLLVEKYAVNINETDADMESALFYVARGNSWWQVHQALPYLLDAGADVHMRNKNGQTPLHMALQTDDDRLGPFYWDAVELLIERGADVYAVDGKGRSCLAYAQHDIDMINFLIKHGATVTVDSVFGAIDSGNTKVLQALLSSGIDPNTRRVKPLESPKEEKARHVKKDIGPLEEFPLYYAFEKLHINGATSDEYFEEFANRMEVVRILVQHGADPFAKFAKRVTGAEDESSLTEPQVTTIEVPKGYRECTLLHEALYAGIIADGFLQLPNLDVNHRDAGGRTLLHMICENKITYDGGGPDHTLGSFQKSSGIAPEERVTSFQRLLSLGAELEARDNFGRNIVHYMLAGEEQLYFTSYKRALAYVIDKAPNLLNQADENGDTSFHYAARRANTAHTTKELEMLLAVGADHKVVNKKGETLLHIMGECIALDELRDLFLVLADRGIDINARNKRGETALFSFYGGPADSSGWPYYGFIFDHVSPELVKPVLQKLGGDFFARDNKGRGLLHAAAAGQVDRFQELMDMGLDPMMEDDAHQTAIDAAAACGNRKILELFEKKD